MSDLSDPSIVAIKIPKPKDNQQEKELSDFKLKLLNYADEIEYIEDDPDYIMAKLTVLSDINRKELDKLVKQIYRGSLLS